MSSPSDKLPANQPVQQRLTNAVAAVAELFEREQAEYPLIGGLSVAFRGNKRTTEDADFLIWIGFVLKHVRLGLRMNVWRNSKR